MDPKSQAKLEELLRKEIPELTVDDIVFLRARLSYIGRNDRKRFAEVLGSEPVVMPNEPEALPAQDPHADPPSWEEIDQAGVEYQNNQ